MIEETGRPLDDREQDEFAAIVAGYRRTARRPDDPAAPSQSQSQTQAPTPRTVAVVLGGACAVAVATALLPAPFNLWVPVVALALVAGSALVLGLRGPRPASPDR